MKKNLQSCFLLAAALLLFSVTKIQAQTAAPTVMHQKDMIGDNPTADADIKTVSDFTNALVSGDIDKAKSFLTDKCINYGPGPADSANVAQFVAHWQENYKMQSNRKVNFVAESFNVKSGDLQGNWVAAWGDYTFTSNGITVKFPYQCSYHVTNGKIDSSRIYYDQLYIVQKLGFTLTPPASK
ncbi:nuclear transport factor 2 family protein [Mucilaginibacter sp. McL0603]|uniref:nuclear transport factor 2 family protein n=1 Tax=Mucilaginibacter sp. McL0603 TaxID=3415670 RepID=UPI003CF42764